MQAVVQLHGLFKSPYHNSSGSAVAALVGRLYYRQPLGVARGVQVVLCERGVLREQGPDCKAMQHEAHQLLQRVSWH